MIRSAMKKIGQLPITWIKKIAEPPIRDFNTTVTGSLPESTLAIPNAKKVDVLVALYMSLRSNIAEWINRSYRATAWSVGLLMTATGYWVLRGSETPLSLRIVVALGLFLFGSLTQCFLYIARGAHHATGRAIDRVQATLRLCDEDIYIKDARFFGFSGRYLAPMGIAALQVLHGVSLLFCLGVVLFL